MAINGNTMKKGNELGLTIIKCQNKTGTDNLKDLHRRINAILYVNMYRYIDQQLACDIYTELCGIGKDLSDLKVPESARAKKEELLGELRKRCTVLKDYKKIPNTVDDVPQMQAVINYTVHICVEAKNNNNITPEEVLGLIKETKRVYNAFSPFEEHLKIETLVKFNGELIRYIETTLGIRQ